jgi:hypothetical protein
MVKICTKCKLKYPDDTSRCSKCYGELVDRKTLMANARITVTITKPFHEQLASEAQTKNMVLSEYVAHLLRERAVLVPAVPSKTSTKKKT